MDHLCEFLWLLKKLGISVIVVVVLVTFLVISSPVILYRKILSCVAKVIKPELKEILSSRSAALAVDDLRERPVISEVFLMVLEGEDQLEIEQIRDIFIANALEYRNPKTGELQYPELRQRIAFYKGYPFWASIKGFKVEDYIYVHPEYKEEPFDYERVMKLGCELKSKPFPEDKATWEFIFIPKFVPRAERKPKCKYSVVLYRQHHCLADGFSKIKFLQQLSVHPPPPFMKINIPQTNWITLSLFYLSLVIKLPFEIADFIMTYQPTNIWKTRTTSKEGCASPTMSYMGSTSKKIPLSIIKEIKNKYGVSFSAVAITAAVSAMEVRMAEGKRSFPDLIMTMPFPMGGHPDKLRNHFSFAFLKVPIREKDIVKRLKIIDGRLEKLKRSAVSILLGGMFGQLVTSLPVCFPRKLLKISSSGHGMMMTNFPGPTAEMDLFGHTLKEIYMCGPAGSGTLGMVSSFITYGEAGFYGVGGDLAILPDENCAEEVVEEFRVTLDYLLREDPEKSLGIK